MVSFLLPLIYICFISLGLPDAVLGSAWPIIRAEFGVSVDSMGILTILMAVGTTISSLMSDRLIKKLGVYKISVISIAITAACLLGFAISPSFFAMCLWAVPYGLGAGSIDAALNNFVAVHYESKHMSWLHCMWGLGASLGPYVMGMALTHNMSYNVGYYMLFAFQSVLTLIVFFSARLWKTKKVAVQLDVQEHEKVLTLKEIFRIPGVIYVAIAFFCYCAIEQTVGLWATSYLVLSHGMNPEVAASLAALFYLGITVGRGFNGFLSMKFSDTQLIRGGSAIIGFGILLLFMSSGDFWCYAGLILIGLGCAPIYPCMIHSTPHSFGVANSQAVTGVQMAAAYVGTLIMPALFGVLGRSISFNLYPIYIAIILLTMVVIHEILIKKVGKGHGVI